MEEREPLGCHRGLDLQHDQLLTRGVLNPDYRRAIKHAVFQCFYSSGACDWKLPYIHGIGLGTGLPNDGDFADLELRVLEFLNKSNRAD